MNDDPEFDIYDEGGFDDAFAELINSLKEVESCARSNELTTNGSPLQELQRDVSGALEDDCKVPHEAVGELNKRISKATLSPFDRFRSQRGTLSVRLA